MHDRRFSCTYNEFEADAYMPLCQTPPLISGSRIRDCEPRLTGVRGPGAPPRWGPSLRPARAHRFVVSLTDNGCCITFARDIPTR